MYTKNVEIESKDKVRKYEEMAMMYPFYLSLPLYYRRSSGEKRFGLILNSSLQFGCAT